MPPGDRHPFHHYPHTHGRGRAAERAAASWLERRGYAIEARNHATRAGEIDLVARDGETLCFIEIKARASRDWGPPAAAVHRKKQLRLGRAAALYLLEHSWDGDCRFDVLGVVAEEGGGWSFELVRDAFEL